MINKDPLFSGTIPSFGSMNLMEFEEADRQRWNWGRMIVGKSKEAYGQEARWNGVKDSPEPTEA